MQILENQTFTDQVVSIDDKSFINCIFTRCTLLYSGGELNWYDTQWINCTFNFGGCAARTAELLHRFGQSPATPIGIDYGTPPSSSKIQ
jgi:hypothetical protein